MKQFNKSLALFSKWLKKHCKPVSPVHYTMTNPANTRGGGKEDG